MPDGLEPAFWDAEKGEVKWGDLSKEVAALRTAKAEWENAKSVVPENPDKYEFKLPEGFQAPEGMQLNPDDPRLPLVRKLAHEANLSQKQFEALIRMDAEVKAAEVAQFNARMKAEQEKLGPDGGKARVEAVTRGLVGQVGQEMAKHLVPMMVGAVQVQAFEQLLSKLSAQGTATAGYTPGNAAGTGRISDEEWNRMTPTERMTFAIQNSAKPVAKRA
ncbi:MAG: hypothetical protein ACRCTG_15485 [Aestuariivirga sp.]